MVRASRDLLGELFLLPTCKAILSKIEGCRAPGYDRACPDGYGHLMRCEASGRKLSKHFRSRSCRRFTAVRLGEAVRRFQDRRGRKSPLERDPELASFRIGPKALEIERKGSLE